MSRGALTLLFGLVLLALLALGTFACDVERNLGVDQFTCEAGGTCGASSRDGGVRPDAGTDDDAGWYLDLDGLIPDIQLPCPPICGS